MNKPEYAALFTTYQRLRESLSSGEVIEEPSKPSEKPQTPTKSLGTHLSLTDKKND